MGLNMAGLMLEMIGLYQSAAKAYEMALTALSESDEVRKLLLKFFFFFWRGVKEIKLIHSYTCDI